MIVSCSVCGKNNWKPLYTNLQECQNCGMIKAADHFFKQDAKEIYTEAYFKNSDYADYQVEKNALEKNFTDRLSRIKRFKKSGDLFEVGCAYGYFLNLAKKYFNASGIDLDPIVCKLAKKNSGVKVLSGDLLKKQLQPNSYDIVCMFDTIEHLQNPNAYLKKANQILRSGGIIVIETGDIGSFLAKIQKGKWRLIKPPFHLQYFSIRTLGELLTKEGFSIISTDRVPFYRSLRQILFSLTKNFTLLKIINRLPDINFTLNTYDLIFVVAQKKYEINTL